MTGLILKLAPHERVLINGAVIENGERRSRFCIVTPNANILRLRDAIHPEQARTPVSRIIASRWTGRPERPSVASAILRSSSCLVMLRSGTLNRN